MVILCQLDESTILRVDDELIDREVLEQLVVDKPTKVDYKLKYHNGYRNVIIIYKSDSVAKLEKAIKNLKEKRNCSIKLLTNGPQTNEVVEADTLLNITKRMAALELKFDQYTKIAMEGEAALPDINYIFKDDPDNQYIVDGTITLDAKEVCFYIDQSDPFMLYKKCIRQVLGTEELAIKKQDDKKTFEQQKSISEKLALFSVRAINDRLVNKNNITKFKSIIKQSELKDVLNKMNEAFNRQKGNSRKKRKIADDTQNDSTDSTPRVPLAIVNQNTPDASQIPLNSINLSVLNDHNFNLDNCMLAGDTGEDDMFGDVLNK